MSFGERALVRAASRLRLRRRATVALLAPVLLVVSACGGDDVVSRPAHRPISVIYVAGPTEGAWVDRAEGLADGVKLAIADRDGLIGERAVSTVVVPIEQRDGNTVSAAIGAGRILRDSRAIAVLGTYTAPQLAISAPQLNGGELSVLQYGSGLRGLTGPEEPGEPGRFEPSGHRFALRGVPSDEAVAERVGALKAFRGAQVVPVTDAYEARLEAEAKQRAKDAKARRATAIEDGDDPVPSTNPTLTNPSPEVPDAERLANAIAGATGGKVVEPGAIDPAKPLVVVTDPTEPDPSAAVRALARETRGPLLAVDGADRELRPSALARTGASDALMIRRTLADADTKAALELRRREKEAFGRDRGDAVVAGYRAANRILELAANQPTRTIDRVKYADDLTAASPNDPFLPSTESGDATLGEVQLYELRGGRWTKR